MHRSQIMNSDNLLDKTITAFKTVPMQELNMLYKYIGEAKAGVPGSKKRAAEAVGAWIVSNIQLELIGAGVAALTGVGWKAFKGDDDDDDEVTWESFFTNLMINVGASMAGTVLLGSEVYEWVLYLATGKTSYGDDFSIFGTEMINEVKDQVLGTMKNTMKIIGDLSDIRKNGGDVGQYLDRHKGDILGDIHNAAKVALRYAKGFPADNLEKYLGGTVGRAIDCIFPGTMATVSGWFDTTTKADLKYMEGKDMPTRLNSLLAIRNIDVDDGTTEEMARLYQAGYKSAVPTDTPEKITVNGEERELTPYEMQTYDNAYSAAIAKSLDALVESEEYIRADDQTRERMLTDLYKYAEENASREIYPEYKGSNWTRAAEQAAEEGLPLEAYIALQGSGLEKTAEKMDFVDEMKITDEQKGKLYYYGIASDERQEDLDNLRKAGMDWGTAYETVKQYMEIDGEDISANQKAAEFATWAADNLTAEETAAARENLQFHSGFTANPETYDKLKDAGLSADSALQVYSSWGALVPDEDHTQVTDNQRIADVVSSDLSIKEKAEAISILDTAIWKRLHDTNISQEGAVKVADAIAKLKPEAGKSTVSELAMINASYSAVSGEKDQAEAIKAAMSYDETRQKFTIAQDHGITSKTYVDYRNTVQNYYAWDPSGSATSLSQKECQAALDSMNLTLYDKAVLWQIQTMGKDGKNNPYSTGVGKEIYDAYMVWSAEEESKSKTTETKSEDTGWTGNGTSNFPGLQLPTLDIPGM